MKGYTLYNKVIASVSLVALLLTALPAAGATQPYYRQLLSKPDSTLVRMSRDLLHQQGMQDSAFICLSAVVSRYERDPEKSDLKLVAHSYQMMGYMYMTYFYDYSKSIDYLDKSQRICDANHFDEINIYNYIDKWCARMLYANFVEQSSYDAEAMSLLCKGFNLAKKEGYEYALTSCFTNMASTVLDSMRIDLIRPEIEYMSGFLKRRPDKFSHFDRDMVLGMVQLVDGNTEGARRYFRQMLTDNDYQEVNLRDRSDLMVRFWLANTYRMDGNLKSAVSELLAALPVVRKANIEDGLVEIYRMLSELYSALGDSVSSDKYNYLYLKSQMEFSRRSRLLHVSQKQLESRIDSMNGELSRMDRQHHNMVLLLAGAAVAVVVVLVFIIVLYRHNRQQRRYIKLLYDKNMQLVNDYEHERKLRLQFNPPINDVVKDGHQAETIAESGSATADKHSDSDLSDENKAILTYRIQRALDDNELVCSPDFSLSMLASRVGSNSHYVSEMISGIYGTNFKSVVNDIRVKMACLRLADTEHYGNLTIDAIAESVGFRSRGNFSVVFRKITGMSASQFRRNALFQEREHALSD